MSNQGESGGPKQSPLSFLRARGLWPIGLVVVIVLIIAGQQFHANRTQPPPAITTLTLQMDWIHSGDFIGYYAADQLGYYASAGLVLKFLEGGQKSDPVASVVAGDAQFGMVSASGLVDARSSGLAVRAIACIYQRSPLAFASMAETGIRHPRDFMGRTLRLPTQSIPTLRAMMTNAGAEVEKVEIVQTRDTSRFLSGEIDVWGAYLTSSIRRLRNGGAKLFILHPDDFGVHGYQQCIFTTDDLIEKEPELVGRLLTQTLKGWRYAADNIDESGALVENYVEVESRAETIDYVRSSLPLFYTGDRPIGFMDPAIWRGMVESLYKSGAIDDRIDPTLAYTLEFLPAATGAGSTAASDD